VCLCTAHKHTSKECFENRSAVNNFDCWSVEVKVKEIRNKQEKMSKFIDKAKTIT